ncbi:hypothetical protein ACJMK2_031412 [Sinanodonta woodiana]|uniref:Carrier domain-containing protein n=1 Tax=Sinanodonta woodiana TaxID=1069815 RepID=A0ABD3WYQ5_SINWO
MNSVTKFNKKQVNEACEMSTLQDLVWEDLDRKADSIAVIYDKDDTPGLQAQTVKITYRELYTLTKKVSDVLMTHVQADEVVGVCLKPSQHIPAVLLGVLDVGCSFYCFEGSSAVKAAVSTIRRLHIQTLLLHLHILQHHMQKAVEELQGEVLMYPILTTMDLVLVHIKAVTKMTHRGQLAYCITTSGTTGLPKVVCVPHRCILPNILHFRAEFNLCTQDCVLLASPLTFDPSIVDLFMALTSGASLLIIPDYVKMMPKNLLSAISRNKVTVIQCTPMLIYRMDPKMVSLTLLGPSTSLRVLAMGGESFPHPSYLKSILDARNTAQLYNLYGTTELSCWAMLYKVNDSDLQQDCEIPLGKPIIDTDIMVVDKITGSTVSEGEGYLYIGSKIRKCILDGEEDGENVYNSETDVWRDTGDLVKVTQEGSIFYLDRGDNQRKRNGKRLNLDEITIVVKNLPFVKDCCAVLDDNTLVVCVVLCVNRSQSPVDIQTHIKDHIKSHLPSQYHPDGVLCLPALPMTRHGKFDSKAVLQAFKKMRSNHPFLEPTDLLRSLWKELLNFKDNVVIDAKDNFLLSGGDSFQAVQLLERVEAGLGCQLRLSELVQIILHKTYQDVLQYLIFKCQENVVINQTSCDMSHNPVLATKLTADIDQLREGPGLLIDHQSNKILDENDSTNIMIGRGGPNFMSHTGEIIADPPVKVSRLQCMGSLSRGNKKTFSSELNRKYNQQTQETICKHCNGDRNTHRMDTSGVVSMEISWQFNTGKCVDASPLLVFPRQGDPIVCIGSHSHRFFALNFSSGVLTWEITLGDRIESSACLSLCGNFIIVGCYDYKVYVIDTESGAIWWSYQTSGEVKSSPAVDPKSGTIYIGSHDQHIYALDIVKRKCLWKQHLGGGSVFSSPTSGLKSHHVYAATLTGSLVALNPMDGRKIWAFECGKPLFSSPCLTKIGVVIGCVDTNLFHIDYTGNLLWKFKTEAPIFSSPCVTQIFIPLNDITRVHIQHDDIMQNDMHCGEDKPWSMRSTVYDESCGNTENEVIIFGSHDHHLYCILTDGVLLWKVVVDSQIYSTGFPFNLTDKTNLTCTSQNSFPSKQRSACTLSEITDKDSSFICLQRAEVLRWVENSNLPICESTGESVSSLGCLVTFCSTKGIVYIVRALNGEKVAQLTLPGEVFSSPVVFCDKLIVGCRDNNVYGYDLKIHNK